MTSPDNKKKPLSSDEIDFEAFLQSIRVQQNKLRSTMRKKWKLLLLCAVIGAGVGYFLTIVIPPVYRAEMTVSQGSQPNVILHERTFQLNQLIEEGRPEELAKVLNLPLNVVSTLEEITYLNINRNVEIEDSIVLNYYFVIQVKVNNNNLLDELQPALLTYLEGSEFLEKRKQLRIEMIRQQITNLEKNLLHVDSLKQIMAASLTPRSRGQGLIYGEPPDQVNVINKGVDLHDIRISKIQELEMVDVEVVNEFIPSEKPVFPKKSVFMGAGILLGLILALSMPVRE